MLGREGGVRRAREHAAAAGRVDAADGPLQQPPAPEVDRDVERRRHPVVHRQRRLGQLFDGGLQLREHAGCQRPWWQRAAPPLRLAEVGGADTGQPGGEHPVADVPLLQPVELGFQSVGHRLLPVGDPYAEPAPQEGPRRVLQEGEQVRQRHVVGAGGERSGQEGRCRQPVPSGRAGAVERAGVEAEGAPPEKLRASKGWSG